MSKQEITLKKIIYKNRSSFLLKNNDKLKKEIKLLKLNSDQITSLINELQFEINSKRGLSPLISILAFMLSVLSLYISSSAFLFSTYFQNIFELSSLKQKSTLFKQMMHTTIFKDIETILLFFTQPTIIFSILILFFILYPFISLIHIQRLKNKLSVLYTCQREF